MGSSERRAIPLFATWPALEPLISEVADRQRAVLGSGRYILGPEVEAFEAEFAAYVGRRHCVGVASGTDALTISLRSLGVGPGDEVVVPAYTFFATAEAVVNAGARPVSPLSGGCSLRTLRASSRDVIGIANPLDFADRKRASHASLLSFLIEQGSNLGIGVHRRQRSHTLDHLWAGLAFFPRHFVAWDGKLGEGLRLPANSDIDDIAALRERHILDQPPHELLTLHKSRRRGVPDRRSASMLPGRP